MNIQIHVVEFESRYLGERIVTILIVYLCNDTGNDHTGGSDIFMALCIIN